MTTQTTTQNTSNRFNTAALDQACQGFARNLGNGALALQHAVFIFEASAGDGNTMKIARMVKDAKAKGDAVAASSILYMMGKVWPGFKRGKDKNDNTVFKVAGIKPDMEAVTKLLELVEKKTSIRSMATIRKAFPKDERAYSLVKSAAPFVKNAIKANLTEAAVIAAVKQAYKEAQTVN